MGTVDTRPLFPPPTWPRYEAITPLEVNSMTRCVGGSLVTSLDRQGLYLVLVIRSTLPMLMELVPHMASPHPPPPPPPHTHTHTHLDAAGYDKQVAYSCCTCPCAAGSTNENRIPSFVHGPELLL